MKFLPTCVALLATRAFAAVVPVERQDNGAILETRQRQADNACRHGPYTRACWSAGHSIATDFDAKMPPEGKTVEYDLEITNTTMAPDGHERLMMVINGQYPGPVLTANWGDTLVVNVKNSLQHNGTSIHWHGMRQLNKCQQDGVNGVTECPIPPGGTKRYEMLCTQHGTGWYHSHYSTQYAEGVVGTIIINGPATSNYDIDLGTATLNDWTYETAFVLNHRALHSITGPPVADTILINGSMVSDQGGQYFKTKLQKGKKHRLRLINAGVDNLFHVSIDNHEFTVITSDFVPIKPYKTNSVALAIGQRHDIIIHANQDVGNYWMRVNIGTACSRNLNAGNVKGIISYEGADDEEPTTEMGHAPNTGCYDEDVRPWVDNQVDRDQFLDALGRFDMQFNVSRVDTNGPPLVQWLINGTDIQVDFNKPTLDYVQRGDWSFEPKQNVFEINKRDEWTFWIVQTVQGSPVNLHHPIHLHGHDFYVIGQGSGVYDGNMDNLVFDNPPRRDTANLPAGGYLVMGFPADNPGAWLVHCHIPYHVGQGLSWQFLERKDEILSSIGDLSEMNRNCDNWRPWWNQPLGPNRPYDMDDSGL